jgi:hypothetical protein
MEKPRKPRFEATKAMVAVIDIAQGLIESREANTSKLHRIAR